MDIKRLFKRILKIIGGLIALVLMVALAGLAYHYFHQVIPERNVMLTVAYAEKNICDKDYTIGVMIENKSERTVIKTYFDVIVKREGYSDNIARWSYRDYKTDKIIKPGEKYFACWLMPDLQDKYKGKYKSKDLKYSIGNKRIIFED